MAISSSVQKLSYRMEINSDKTMKEIPFIHMQTNLVEILEKNKLKHNTVNYLLMYFDFSYFIFYTPFRIVRSKCSEFEIESSLFHRIVSATLNMHGFLLRITDFRLLIFDLVRDDLFHSPEIYFRIVSHVVSVCFQGSAFYHFWKYPQDYLNIVHFSEQERDFLSIGSSMIQKRIFTKIFCIIYLILALHQASFMYLLAPNSSWNMTVWNRDLISFGKYTFFFINATLRSEMVQIEDLTWIDYSLAIFVAIGRIHSLIVGYICDLSLLLTTLNIWTVMSSFASQIHLDIASAKKVFTTRESKRTNRLTWPEIYKTYKVLRELCELVNKPFGTMIMLYLTDTILFQSIAMETIIANADWTYRLRLAVFLCASLTVFLLSADACRQLDAVNHWLAVDSNRYEVPVDELNLVKDELQNKVVGLRGGNIFTITYSVLWNVSTSVVTYFIICLQSRHKSSMLI